MLPLEFQRIIFSYASPLALVRLKGISCFAPLITDVLMKINHLDYIMSVLGTEPDWHMVVHEYDLSEDIITRYQDNISFYDLSTNLCLTLSTIDNFAHKLSWSQLSRNFALVGQGTHPAPEEEVIKMLDKYHERIDWIIFCRHQRLTVSIIERYINAEYGNIKQRYSTGTLWFCIRRNLHLPEEVIARYPENIDLAFVVSHGLLSQELIERLHTLFSDNDWVDVTDYSLRKQFNLVVNHPEWPWRLR